MVDKVLALGADWRNAPSLGPEPAELLEPVA